MPRIDEKTIVSDIKKAFNSLPCCILRKRVPYIKGDPDFTGSYRGKRIEIEVKTIGGKVSSIQAKRIREWQALECICGIAWSLEDAINIIWDDLLPQDKKMLAKYLPEVV